MTKLDLPWEGDGFFHRALTEDGWDARAGLMLRGEGWAWLVYRADGFKRVAWGTARSLAEAKSGAATAIAHERARECED